MVRHRWSRYVSAALIVLVMGEVPVLIAAERTGEGKPPEELHLTQPQISAADAKQAESLPWGIDLLICVAGAKLSGVTFSEAMSQCSAKVP